MSQEALKKIASRLMIPITDKRIMYGFHMRKFIYNLSARRDIFLIEDIYFCLTIFHNSDMSNKLIYLNIFNLNRD